MWKQKLILTIVFVLVIDNILAFESNSSSYSLRGNLGFLADSRNSSVRLSPSNPESSFNNTIFGRLGILGFNASKDIIPEINSPFIEIDEPKNKSYFGSVLDLRYVAIANDLATVWYNIDNGENITLTDNTTFSNSLGGHTFNLYANDTLNNIAYTTRSYTIGQAVTPDEGDGGGGLLKPIENITNITEPVTEPVEPSKTKEKLNELRQRAENLINKIKERFPNIKITPLAFILSLVLILLFVSSTETKIETKKKVFSKKKLKRSVYYAIPILAVIFWNKITAFSMPIIQRLSIYNNKAVNNIINGLNYFGDNLNKVNDGINVLVNSMFNLVLNLLAITNKIMSALSIVFDKPIVLLRNLANNIVNNIFDLIGGISLSFAVKRYIAIMILIAILLLIYLIYRKYSKRATAL